MDRGAWPATVLGVAESDMTEVTQQACARGKPTPIGFGHRIVTAALPSPWPSLRRGGSMAAVVSGIMSIDLQKKCTT